MKDEQNSPDSGAAPRVGPVLETALYVADVDRSVAFYKRSSVFRLLQSQTA